jgi:hypothetical protein
MANVSRPNGFQVVKYRNGASYSGVSTKYYSTADNLFLGDLVKAAADPVASGNGVYQEVDRCSATTDAILGVVVGWEVNPTNLGLLYHTASSTYGVFIADIWDLVLEAQSDDATMVQTDVGLNVDATFTAGTTATGISNMALDGDTAATTAGLQFKILRMVDRPDHDNSDSIAAQRFWVVVNQSRWADQIAGV